MRLLLFHTEDALATQKTKRGGRSILFCYSAHFAPVAIYTSTEKLGEEERAGFIKAYNLLYLKVPKGPARYNL